MDDLNYVAEHFQRKLIYYMKENHDDLWEEFKHSVSFQTKDTAQLHFIDPIKQERYENFEYFIGEFEEKYNELLLC